jgi:hypothetical protein
LGLLSMAGKKILFLEELASHHDSRGWHCCLPMEAL